MKYVPKIGLPNLSTSLTSEKLDHQCGSKNGYCVQCNNCLNCWFQCYENKPWSSTQRVAQLRSNKGRKSKDWKMKPPAAASDLTPCQSIFMGKTSLKIVSNDIKNSRNAKAWRGWSAKPNTIFQNDVKPVSHGRPCRESVREFIQLTLQLCARQLA